LCLPLGASKNPFFFRSLLASETKECFLSLKKKYIRFGEELKVIQK